MGNGISLHVGVNRVDAHHYAGFDPHHQGGWEGILRCCEQDAIDLQAITAAERFTASVLLAEAATVEAVTAAVGEGAASLGPGDMFVLTFSGYGGEVRNRYSDEHWRELTWALHDRQMPQAELTSLLRLFRPGVRVLVVDDSSASGTVRRSMLSFEDPPYADGETRPKNLAPDVVVATYRGNRELYDAILRSCTSSKIEASVLMATGFGPYQVAAEGVRNGVFTEAFLRVWDAGRFQGDYNSFVGAIAAQMPASQVPNLTVRGSGKTFVRSRPLTI